MITTSKKLGPSLEQFTNLFPSSPHFKKIPSNAFLRKIVKIHPPPLARLGAKIMIVKFESI